MDLIGAGARALALVGAIMNHLGTSEHDIVNVSIGPIAHLNNDALSISQFSNNNATQQHLNISPTAPPAALGSGQQQASTTSMASMSATMDVELLITGIVYGLTFLVGIIGNSLIVYSVVHFRRMKSLSNVFLASLATADLILIIFCVPVKFAQLFSYTWTFGKFLCIFVHYIQNLSAICSVYTLTAMSIERYYAIMYPVECRYICTMSQTKRIIILTWLGSIIMAMPVLWTQILMEVGDDEHRGYWCVRDWANQIGWKSYEIYMLTIILIVPLIIMTYSYAHICNKLWSEMHNRKSTFPLSQPAVYIDASANKMSQVIKMLIVVVVIFVLCWSPILIINVLTAFAIMPSLNYGHVKAIRTTFHLFSYANSCVNPIIYGFMSRNFRASFRAALVKCLGCKKDPHADCL